MPIKFEQLMLDGLKSVKEELTEVKLELARKEHIEPRVEALEKALSTEVSKLQKQLDEIHNIPNVFLKRFLLMIVGAFGIGTAAWFLK